MLVVGCSFSVVVHYSCFFLFWCFTVLLFAGCLARKLFILKWETAAALLIQKHVRQWLLRHIYSELHSASIVIQSIIRGFLTRQRFSNEKKHKAATSIQVCYASKYMFVHHTDTHSLCLPFPRGENELFSLNLILVLLVAISETKHRYDGHNWNHICLVMHVDNV